MERAESERSEGTVPSPTWEDSAWAEVQVGVVGTITAPQRGAHPHSRNLWICYLTPQKRLCKCDQGPRDSILDHPGGLSVITKAPQK